jgi:hypothetical protein
LRGPAYWIELHATLGRHGRWAGAAISVMLVRGPREGNEEASAAGVRSQVFLPGSYACQGRFGMRPQASDSDECLYLNSINPDVQTAEVVRIENAHGDESIVSGMAEG